MKMTHRVLPLNLSFLLATCALIFGINTSFAKEKQVPQDAQDAIIMINHINWVVNRINSASDNVFMLEHEYEGISLNALNLKTIKDRETIAQITTLCDYITSLRIDEGERKMLKRELDYNLDNAIYDAFPSPASLVAADPYAIAINLVQSTISSYMNYKRTVATLKIQYERKMWNLKAESLRQLNSMNTTLLQHQWELIQHYELNDYWRVTEKQIKELLDRINNPIYETDTKELYRYLNHPTQREKFKKLPAFWYYLGFYAERQKDKKTALEAYNEYQKEFLQVLRCDRTAASVAMNKTLLLLEDETNKDKIYEQLKIIEHNAEEDWTFLYFCANVYYEQFKDKDNARRLLELAINSQQHQFSSTLHDLRELCKKGEVKVDDNTFPNATPLITCKNLLVQVNDQAREPKALEEIVDLFRRDTTKNCFAMLALLGKLPQENVSEYLSPELRSIILEYQFDSSLRTAATYRFVLCMPLSWFYAGKFDIETVVYFGDNQTPMKLQLHPRYSDPNPVVTKDELVRYVIDCPNSIVRNLSPSRIELTLGHKFYPITLVFDATGLKNATTRDIEELRMLVKKAKYKKSLSGQYMKEFIVNP